MSAQCATTLLTWLRPAVTTTGGDGERLTLPARDVVRAVVPPASGVVRAGRELFDWLHRRDLAVTGPTVEEHLVDAEGASATVLEIPVAQNREPGTRRSR